MVNSENTKNMTPNMHMNKMVKCL